MVESYLLFLTPFIIPIVNAVAVLPVKGIPRIANVVDVIGKMWVAAVKLLPKLAENLSCTDHLKMREGEWTTQEPYSTLFF